MEKEQVTVDLNAMESSFSELFKRLEKYKGVLEGYKKVGTPTAQPFSSLSSLNLAVLTWGGGLCVLFYI